jgi:hypothetical protein
MNVVWRFNIGFEGKKEAKVQLGKGREAGEGNIIGRKGVWKGIWRGMDELLSSILVFNESSGSSLIGIEFIELESGMASSLT